MAGEKPLSREQQLDHVKEGRKEGQEEGRKEGTGRKDRESREKKTTAATANT